MNHLFLFLNEDLAHSLKGWCLLNYHDRGGVVIRNEYMSHELWAIRRIVILMILSSQAFFEAFCDVT